MKKQIMNTATVLAIASTLLLGACRRDRNLSVSNDETGSGMEYARLQQVFDDAGFIADEAASSGGLAHFRTTGGATPLSHCATITHDTISVPHTLTIDFGTTNCLCHDGRYRRGQILVSYTGKYRDSGHVHTITFNNYFVNDNQVTGTKTVTNMGHNNQGKIYFSISVNGSVILANNAGTRSISSSRVRTWIQGQNTPPRADDVYATTGSATVTRPNNTTLAVQITSPLVRALNCHWISQGTVQMTPQTTNPVVRTLDYGNGVCDALATLTVGNNTYNITLP